MFVCRVVKSFSRVQLSVTPWTAAHWAACLSGDYWTQPTGLLSQWRLLESLVRLLERVVISFSRDLPNPGTESTSPALLADYLPLSH